MNVELNEDPLLRFEREDKERAKLLDEALNEISLFNLRLEESVKDKNNEINSETNDTKKKDSDIKEEFGVSNGIKFFNEENFECSFNEESLIQEFLENKVPVAQEFGKEASLDKILAVLSHHNQSHCTWSGPVFKVVMEFCFQLLGTSQSTEMLHKIVFCIIEALNNLKFSPLKLIAKLLPNVIKNMGGNVDAGQFTQEQKVPETSDLSLLNADVSTAMKTTENSNEIYTRYAERLNSCENAKSNSSSFSEKNSESRKSIDIVANFKSIMLVLSKVLFKEVEAKKHSNIPDYKLDQMFTLILKAAQDPLILSSYILFIIQNCLQLILEKYTYDCSFKENKVQDFVENIYFYWEDCLPKLFNHSLACCVLTDLIPLSDKGQLIRSSLALLAINCCLSNEDVELEVLDDVSISYLADFCINKVDVINQQNVSKIYSVMLMIDVAIDKPLRDEDDKHHLSRLLELISSIQVAVSSTDPNKKKLDCLIKVLSSGWKRLMNPVSQRPLKQRTMDDFVNSEYRRLY